MLRKLSTTYLSAIDERRFKISIFIIILLFFHLGEHEWITTKWW